jgi:hypothetical protein
VRKPPYNHALFVDTAVSDRKSKSAQKEIIMHRIKKCLARTYFAPRMNIIMPTNKLKNNVIRGR